MRKFILILIIIFASASAFAQDFSYGASTEELDMKKYAKDTSAHAVVLNEHGLIRITPTNLDEIRLIVTYHVRIKFFDEKEFQNFGTVEVPIYSSDGITYEKVRDVQGTTYYKDDNGNMQQAELDPKKVFTTVEDKHHSTMKFAMPALRKGCVIDIKYELETPYFYYNFPRWLFQDYIPKINSECEVHIPGFWYYNATLRGYLKLTSSKVDNETGCFSYRGASAGCSFLDFGMKDIPAFVAEDYMTSPKNYMSGVYFDLMEMTNMETNSRIKVSKEWKDVDYSLKDDYSVGGQLKRKELLKEKIAPVIAGKTDSLQKAQAIYAYIQKNFKWNEIPTFFSNDGIKKAFDAHSGNSGDINLSLVTALNSASIPAQAVLLSTRSNGTINKLYPSITGFNYVVARTVIGGKIYLLDATDPHLAFGMLPMRCLNDQGRVFSLDKPSYWTDMVTPQRQTTTYTFDLTLQDDGKLKGTIKRYSIGYSGYLKRKEIKKFNSLDEYVEHVEGELAKTKILKSNSDNIDSLDKPVAETYDVEINLYNSMNHDRLAFSPFLLDQVKTNPFKLAQRAYPVDWGMPSDDRYIVTIHVPPQYTIENPPQGISFVLPNQGGRFITDYQGDNNTFTFSYVTQFNKSIYGAEEYPYLKELYNKIILSEKVEMVFKKKI